jgi:hypothetical protein
MALSTKATGEKTNSTVKEQKPGLMEPAILETTLMERNTEWGSSLGLMGAPTTESSLITILMARECTSGQTAGSLMEIGRTIKWKEAGCSLGLITDATKESTSMIRKKATESFTGLMGGSTKDSGRMGSNMEKDCTHQPVESREEENGLMERG